MSHPATTYLDSHRQCSACSLDLFRTLPARNARVRGAFAVRATVTFSYHHLLFLVVRVMMMIMILLHVLVLWHSSLSKMKPDN